MHILSPETDFLNQPKGKNDHTKLWSGPLLSAYGISGYCSICWWPEKAQNRLHRCARWSGPTLSVNCIRALFVHCALYVFCKEIKKIFICKPSYHKTVLLWQVLKPTVWDCVSLLWWLAEYLETLSYLYVYSLLKHQAKFVADNILFFFFFFFIKVIFDISCELSAWQTVHMKCQNLLSVECKKYIYI